MNIIRRWLERRRYRLALQQALQSGTRGRVVRTKRGDVVVGVSVPLPARPKVTLRWNGDEYIAEDRVTNGGGHG